MSWLFSKFFGSNKRPAEDEGTEANIKKKARTAAPVNPYEGQPSTAFSASEFDVSSVLSRSAYPRNAGIAASVYPTGFRFNDTQSKCRHPPPYGGRQTCVRGVRPEMLTSWFSWNTALTSMIATHFAKHLMACNLVSMTPESLCMADLLIEGFLKKALTRLHNLACCECGVLVKFAATRVLEKQHTGLWKA